MWTHTWGVVLIYTKSTGDRSWFKEKEDFLSVKDVLC
jgi:hypothetical protein